MGITIYKNVEVEVDVDTDDLADLSKKELAEVGLSRCTTAPRAPETDAPLDDQWRAIRRLIQHGDQRELVQRLNTMAWAQAGVMIPVVATAARVSA